MNKLMNRIFIILFVLINTNVMSQQLKISYFGSNTKPLLPLIVVNSCDSTNLKKEKYAIYEYLMEEEYKKYCLEVLTVTKKYKLSKDEKMFNALTIVIKFSSEKEESYKIQIENTRFRSFLSEIKNLIIHFELTELLKNWRYYEEVLL